MSTNWKSISNIPDEKLRQIVMDLNLENIPAENIRVNPQPDGKWTLEYLVSGQMLAAQGFSGAPPARR